MKFLLFQREHVWCDGFEDWAKIFYVCHETSESFVTVKFLGK